MMYCRREHSHGRQTGHAKIEQFQPIHHMRRHIGRLKSQWTMPRVGRIQGRCDLRRELQRRCFRERATQWNAIHGLHHQVVRADV